MRAEITKVGMLEITPGSMTEETMLEIWFVRDKTNGNKKVKEALVILPFEEIGPACIRSIAETADDVSSLSSEMKKALRKNIKAELDAMVADKGNPLTEYNGRAATTKLQDILEKAKLAVNVDPSEKKPTGETPPEKTSLDTEAAKAQKIADKGAAEPVGTEPTPITLDLMKEAIKKFYAVKGATESKELLLKYKAAKISDVKEKDYVALFNELRMNEDGK